MRWCAHTLSAKENQPFYAEIAACGTHCSTGSRHLRRVRCSSAPHAHPLLPEACSHARTCGSWPAQALQSTMPRNKGIGAKRKKKMPPPKKPEGADAMSMPDNANEKPTTTPGGRSPPSDKDATKSDTALDVLVDSIQTSNDALFAAEYTYELKQRALAVKTRARGSAATKEETMPPGGDRLPQGAAGAQGAGAPRLGGRGRVVRGHHRQGKGV